MTNKYYMLTQQGSKAEIVIYGDITSWPWIESDVSSYTLSKALAEMTDVAEIDVYINSYGGEVAEGLAIYNALRRHKATVKTYCDGFACSIASVVYMAGDERIMSDASMLMIHNAWTRTSGNAGQLRKEADDLDKITEASITAYMSGINISKEKLTSLLDAETWLSPAEALEMGFATSVTALPKTEAAAQSARGQIMRILARQAQETKQRIEVDCEAIARAVVEQLHKEQQKEVPPKQTPVKRKICEMFADKKGEKKV